MYDNESRSRRNRSNVSFAPIVLVLLGIIFLLNNFGILPWEVWQNIWKFWPVLLILFGIEILLGRSSSLKTILFFLGLIFLLPLLLVLNPLAGNPLSRGEVSFDKPLGNLTKVQVFMDLPSNNLTLEALPLESDRSIEARVSYSKLLPKTSVTEDRRFDETKYTFEQSSTYLPFLNNLGNTAQVKLSSLIPNEFYIKSTAGVYDLNLQQLNIPILELQSQASQINIKYASNKNNKTYIKTSAAKIVLTIPPELAAQLKIDSAIKDIKLNKTKFAQEENSYTTSDFSTATVRLQIEITGSASSIEVK